ncbi:hypothetical protein STVA_37370 [Allostella vacuolata]|nr:hypothetical protein STVA_37370 [Stella vacuolata]
MARSVRLTRASLGEILASPPDVDLEKVRATSEEDIERHMAQDGEPAGGYEPQPFPDLKALRARLGMSQDAFGAAIGVPAGTLRNWEQGRTYPAVLPMTYSSRSAISGEMALSPRTTRCTCARVTPSAAATATETPRSSIVDFTRRPGWGGSFIAMFGRPQ